MESTTSPPEGKRKGPGPLLFCIMLGVIVVALAVFMALSPVHGGKGAASKSGVPSAQH